MTILIKNQKYIGIKIQLYFYDYEIQRWKEKERYINLEIIPQIIQTTENTNETVTRKTFIVILPTMKLTTH